MSSQIKLDKARRFLDNAKGAQGNDLHGPAWDDTCRAIYEALSVAIQHERDRGNHRIYDEAKPSNQLNVAKQYKLLPEELLWKAELILQRTDEAYHTMVTEDSNDAIAVAEKIIKTVEQQIEATN